MRRRSWVVVFGFALSVSACTERTPASELTYDTGVAIADAELPTARPDAAPTAPLPPPTWEQDVRPIVSASCLQCHGQVLAGGATMPLVTYADVTAVLRSGRTGAERPVYVLMAAAVASVEAPMPLGGRLPAEQIDVIVRWAEAGAPEGGGTAPVPDGGMDGGVVEIDGGADGGVAEDAEPVVADVGTAAEDAAPAFPDAAPPAPDAAPVTPDAMPVLPDAAPVFPDAAPVFPDAAPPAPDAMPVFPDAAPAFPDAAPVLPDAAPVFPDAAPVFPDAAPPAPDAEPDPPDAAPPVDPDAGAEVDAAEDPDAA